jgi:hypothetical protein
MTSGLFLCTFVNLRETRPEVLALLNKVSAAMTIHEVTRKLVGVTSWIVAVRLGGSNAL